MEKLRKVYELDVLVDESNKVLRISRYFDYSGYEVLNAYRVTKYGNVVDTNLTLNALRAGLNRGTILLY